MMSSYFFSYSLRFFKLVEEHKNRMKCQVSLPSVDSAFAVFKEEFLSVNLTAFYFFKQLLSSLIISIVADKAEHMVWLTTKHSNWFTSCQRTQVVSR